jgi:hypothetical protein
VDRPLRRLDSLAVLALGLAFFIMVWPIEAGIATGLLVERQFSLAFLFATFCSATVLIPVVLSWRRHRSQPEAWRGRGYLITASVIWKINLLMFGSTVVHNLYH